MTDIVERLRKRAIANPTGALYDEAADVIERLRANRFLSIIEQLRADNDRLRAALDEIIMECTCDAIETARAALEGKP
jgi:hypothetical protein